MYSPIKKSVDPLRVLQYVILIGFILYVGQALFVPLSFAVLISFVLYPICKWLEAKKIPRPLAIFLVLLLVAVVVGGLVVIFIGQFQQFSQEWPSLRQKIMALVTSASEYMAAKVDLPVQKQIEWLESGLAGSLPQIVPLIRQVLYSSAVGLVFLILLPFFVALILYHREHFTASLVGLFPQSQKEKILDILRETIITFYNFIKGMAIVYVIVAVLNSTALLLLGIPHAIMFGIIVALLTFIPYVGITIGSLLPIAMAWIVYDSIWYPFGVVAAFTFIQYLEANLIFPLAVSYRLNVNTLFTILAIALGGLIWGTSGMILFVPFIAIVKLIADKVEGGEWLSTILGSAKKS